MKFKEQLYFSLYALKKHKLRFAINCTIILIITIVIFILSSIISTIDKTIDNDFVNAVKNNDYILNVNLQGNNLPNGKWGVNLQEKLKVENLLNEYGELESNYKVFSESVDYILADRKLPLKPIFIDDEFNNNIDGLNYEREDLRVGNIWLGKELAEAAAVLGVELNAGDTINAYISENTYEFRIKGILKNSSDVYVGLEYSLEIGLANIQHIEYQIKNKEFGNIKFLKSFVRNINKCDEGLDKNVKSNTKRLNGTDISGYEVNKEKKADELNPVVHPTSWVYRCCENIAKNYVRKEKRLTVFNENLTTAKCHQDEDTAEILNEIEKLDNCTRRLFLMHYFEGCSLMEIADLLNINYNTVKQLHRRGKIKLEKFFNENISL